MKKDLINALNAVAMARGTVVIDENLRELETYLTEKNIRTRLPPQGASDEKIAHDWLPNRIFITNNSKDFIRYASSYDIGIIATEGVSKDAKELSNLIDDAIRDHSLWSKRHGFILKLQSKGPHIFEPLTD